MKAYAEENGIMNQERRCLIGSMYREKIMVISPFARRAGDADPETRVAETRKLDGNSSYGKTVTNKETHRLHLLSRASSQPLSRRPFLPSLQPAE